MTTLRIKVKPGARTSELEPVADGSWIARVKAPPVDGRANKELIALVAKRFGVRRGDIEIRGGASGRVKWIRVDM